MSDMRDSSGHSLARPLGITVAGILGAVCLTVAANAEPYSKSKPFPALDEVRFGIYATNLEGAGNNDGAVALNGEVLLGRFRPDYSDPVRQFLLNPRPHIGFSLSPKHGTNQVYTGLTWDYHLSKRLFIEGSLGGTVHDGLTEKHNPDSLGCPVLFRESAGVGVELTEQWRVMATVEHSSNAGLCSENQGITNAGVRLGYRW